MLLLVLFSLLLVVNGLYLEGASLVRFVITDREQQVPVITTLSETYGDLVDIWKVDHDFTDILLDGSIIEEAINFMEDHGLVAERITQYSSFPEEEIAADEENTTRNIRALPDSIQFDLTVYHTVAQIHQFMNDVAAASELADVFNIGQSVENRDIRVLKIGASRCQEKQKMLIDCGIHAREWVSPAVCVYLIYHLLDDYGTDAAITSMVDKYDWFFIPVLNPDGYHYSMSASDRRLWRKNRRVNSNGCVGVDLNRNWSYEWGGTGASPNECSNTYRGTGPLSEPEASSVSTWVQTMTGWKGYITYHSYGQYVLYPWGYTRAPMPAADVNRMRSAALEYNAGITATSGKNYFVGQAGSDLYPAAGGSDDWAFGAAGFSVSYTVELRDTGTFGFVLPANQIVPTGAENLAGLPTTPPPPTGAPPTTPPPQTAAPPTTPPPPTAAPPPPTTPPPPTAAPPTAAPPTTAAPTNAPDACAFTCVADGLYADPCSCQNYYSCSEGVATQLTCKGGNKAFSELDEKCVRSALVSGC